MIVATIALLLGACGPAAPNQAAAAKAASSENEGNEAAMRYLDFRHPALVAPVASMARSGSARFVLVEIGEVVNPARISLAFDVSFRPAQGREIRLGTFSLYPPDNPGRFIVATQGRVRAGGQVVVTMESPDALARSGVQVGVARVALVDR